MDNRELKYFELLGIIDEAKAKLQELMNGTQLLPHEVFAISTGLITNTAQGDRDFNALTKKVSHAKKLLKEFKTQWSELTKVLDEIDFKLFLAEAYSRCYAGNLSLVEGMYRTIENEERINNKSCRRQHNKWHGKYRNY